MFLKFMFSNVWGVALLGACLFLAQHCHAQDVSQCSSALVSDQVHSTSQSAYWVYAAYMLTEQQYSQAKTDAAGDGYILGVPVGGSYSDYHTSAEKKFESYTFSFAGSNQSDVLTLTLGQTAGKAYEDCLAENFHGLILRVTDLQSTDVTVNMTFRTAVDDRKLRKFAAELTGGTLGDLDTQWFSKKHAGPIDNYQIHLKHVAHQPMVLEVLVPGPNQKVVLQMPLLPRIYTSDWGPAVDTTHVLYSVSSLREGGSNAENKCVYPSTPNYTLVPGTGSTDAQAFGNGGAESKHIQLTESSERQACWWLQIGAPYGYFAKVEGRFWAQQHQKVQTEVPQDAAWLPQ